MGRLRLEFDDFSFHPQKYKLKNKSSDDKSSKIDSENEKKESKWNTDLIAIGGWL